jgi:hypothetical protein
MKKKTIIIIVVSAAIVGLVLFLFWDQLKALFAKKQSALPIPSPGNTITNNQSNNSTGSVNSSAGTPAITIANFNKGDAIYTKQPVILYSANNDWSLNINAPIKTLAKYEFAGIVHDTKNNIVRVYYNGQKGAIVKSAVYVK